MIWVDHLGYMYGRWAQTHDKAAQFGICVWWVLVINICTGIFGYGMKRAGSMRMVQIGWGTGTITAWFGPCISYGWGHGCMLWLVGLVYVPNSRQTAT